MKSGGGPPGLFLKEKVPGLQQAWWREQGRAGASAEHQARLRQARPRHPTGRHHPTLPPFRSRKPPLRRPPARPGGRKLGPERACSQAPAEFQTEGGGKKGRPVPLSPLSTAPGLSRAQGAPRHPALSTPAGARAHRGAGWAATLGSHGCFLPSPFPPSWPRTGPGPGWRPRPCGLAR